MKKKKVNQGKAGWILLSLAAIGSLLVSVAGSGTSPAVVPVVPSPTVSEVTDVQRTEASEYSSERSIQTEEKITPKKTSTADSDLSNDNYYTNVNGNSVHSPAYSDDGSVPAGASAQCRDGTYSFSQNRRGTCSGHGGVAEWI
jgi:hypothetical protein